MPTLHSLKLHDQQVLWPDHKPLAEVLEVVATTPEYVWSTTYQGHLINPAGNIFQREWWHGNRFHPTDVPAVARWISFDTGLSDTETSAKSAMVAGELAPDYRLRIVDVWSAHVQFPQLIDIITGFARKHNGDDKLSGVIIEDKVSGISAVQTLRQSAEKWLAEKIQTFRPNYGKETRWSQSAIWCKNGCVLLPHPDAGYPWLFEFENDLYEAPNIAYLDTIDAFAQLILFTELLLSDGFQARR